MLAGSSSPPRPRLGRLIAVSLAAALMGAFVVTPALAHEGRDTHGFNLVVGFLKEPAYEGLPNAVSLRVSGPPKMEHGAMAMDTPAHGAIFVSTQLEPGHVFEFKVPDHLDGLTVPYHSHLDPEVAGAITIDRHADAADRVEVELRPGAAHPREITVAAGTTITWTNASGAPQLLASGLHEETQGHQAAAQAVGEHGTAPIEGLAQTLQVEVTYLGSGESTTLQFRPAYQDPGHYLADVIPTQPGPYRFRFFGTIEGKEVDEVFDSGPDTFADVEDQTLLHFPTTLPSARELAGVSQAARRQSVEAVDSAASANALAIVALVMGAVGVVVGAAGATLALRGRKR